MTIKLDTGHLPGSLSSVAANAKAAEEAGFDGFWSAETGHDPFMPHVLAAEHTNRIKLGTSIAVAFPRSPMVTAMLAWDLAEFSKGRFILGLGTQVKGHIERRFSTKWVAPGPRMREYIESLRAIWACWRDGTPLNYVGKHYQFTLMTPFFAPAPMPYARIPIFIAGVNDYMCRLAGELCEGLHVHPFHSIRYLRGLVLPNVEDGLKKSGRSRKDIQLSTSVFVIVGDTPEEIEAAKAPVRQQISFYASTRTYRAVLEAHGWGDVSDQLNRLSVQGDWGGMASLITDEMLEEYAVIGRRDEIIDKIKARYEGILDRFAFYFPYDPAEKEKWAPIIKAFNGDPGS
jgi:probable F420-dependent oxidoreductase